MRRDDRLRGLAQLAVIAGGPRLQCIGVPDHVVPVAASGGLDTRSTAQPDSALVVADSVREAQAMVETIPGSVSVAWLIWPTGRSTPATEAARRAGLRPLARFGVVGDPSSPNHLVRLGNPSSQRWFADSVRPAWGMKGRVARTAGKLPVVAPWGFGGQALLVTGQTRPRAWPLAPEGGHGIPATIALGGGTTAGRSVLTYADGQGRPVRHVKVEPCEAGMSVSRLMSEDRALEVVGRLAPLRGSVPTLLGKVQEPDWRAFAQSHLPGVVLERRWEAPHRTRDWEKDVGDVVDWLCRMSSASAGLSDAAVPTERRTADLPSGLPAGLRAAISRGHCLAATTSRMVHGDLWPANVVRGPSSTIGVLDWESAALGHPLMDALSFLVTATWRRFRGRATLAEACRAALTGELAGRSEQWLRRVLTSVGMPGVCRSGLQDLVLSQLVELAFRPAPGGGADAERMQDWMACVCATWDGWGGQSDPHS